MKRTMRKYSVVALLLCAGLAYQCSTPTDWDPQGNDGTSTGLVISLDDSSRSARAFTLASASGDTLTIEAGTLILTVENGPCSFCQRPGVR